MASRRPLRGLEKAILKALEMVVGPPAQLVLHVLGEVAPEQPVEVFEQGFRAQIRNESTPSRASLGGNTNRYRFPASRSSVSGHHNRTASRISTGWAQVEEFVEHQQKRPASQTRRLFGDASVARNAGGLERVAMGPWMGLSVRRMKSHFNPGAFGLCLTGAVFRWAIPTLEQMGAIERHQP